MYTPDDGTVESELTTPLHHVHTCCRVLQYVAACCVAVCCSVLQCVALIQVLRSELLDITYKDVAEWCSMVQRVVLQCVAVR